MKETMKLEERSLLTAENVPEQADSPHGLQSPEELVDGVVRTRAFSFFRRRRGRCVSSKTRRKQKLLKKCLLLLMHLRLLAPCQVQN